MRAAARARSPIASLSHRLTETSDTFRRWNNSRACVSGTNAFAELSHCFGVSRVENYFSPVDFKNPSATNPTALCSTSTE
jgi:hypothetical protein